MVTATKSLALTPRATPAHSTIIRHNGPRARNQGQECTDKYSLIYSPLHFKWSGIPAWHTYTVCYQNQNELYGLYSFMDSTMAKNKNKGGSTTDSSLSNICAVSLAVGFKLMQSRKKKVHKK